jgi:hypothetical protein
LHRAKALEEAPAQRDRTTEEYAVHLWLLSGEDINWIFSRNCQKKILSRAH